MQNSIVTINAAEFGLEESKAAQIAEQFKPMLDKMVELESEYNKVIQLPIDDPKTSEAAKKLRLQYVKVRTGTAEIHKQQKAFYLAGGRYVDGWKNAQLFASQGIEEKLESIEKHFENLEKERQEKLRNERLFELQKYNGIEPGGLALMAEDVFQNYLLGVKLAYEQQIEAQRKAEEERIAKEKAEAEERERIRIENERLRAEAEEREKQLQLEREKAEAEKRAIEEKARIERQEAERIAAEERAKQEALLKAEREAKEKLEAEIRAKKLAEEKAKAEEEAKIAAELKAKADAEKKALAAPDKTKLNELAKTFEEVQLPILKTKEAIEIIENIKILQSKLVSYIKDKAQTL